MKVLYIYSCMTLRVYILFICLIFFSAKVVGQKKLKVNKNAQLSHEELLEHARDIHISDPNGAIKIIDGFLNNKSNSYSKKGLQVDLVASAYTLLGDINSNIDQLDLAISRYTQGLELLAKTKYFGEKKLLYYKIGQMYLRKEAAEDAKINFTRCIEIKEDQKLSQRCEVGLADVELLLGNVEETFSQLERVRSNYTLDSLEKAQIEAKRSQGYSQNNDYTNASRSLENSIKNLPSKADKNDYKEIEKARKDILDNVNISNVEKIDAPRTKLPAAGKMENLAEIAVRENLEVASLYEEENKLKEAQGFIQLAKQAINTNTAAVYVAEVYKKSAEINQKKGAINTALADFEKYIEAKELAIEELREELNQSVAIVQGQQKIDIGEKDNTLRQKDKELLQSQVSSQRWLIGLLSLLLAGSLVFFYFINKNVKAKRKANQLLLLKSLRTQMNPHFIFNALNSVNNFIAKNDEKAANKYLSEFSKLMRKVLDHSQKDLVPFEEEMELNALYLKLEHFRFRDKFEYEFEKNIPAKAYELEVPPMLIQPFVENAVWHGLRYKEGQGKLKLAVNELNNNLVVTIEDDGIGRERSKELKTINQRRYKSTGMENVSERLALINKVYNKNYKIEIDDAKDSDLDAGTIVSITIPM